MGLFVSTHINKVDRKGRVSVPSSFRSALAEQSFAGVVIYPSFQINAVIEGCGMDFLEKIAVAADSQFDIFSEQQNDINTLIYSSCYQLAWDAEGRIILPEAILEILGHSEQVAFVGLGRTFQIWEPKSQREYKEAAMERMKKSRPKLVIGGGVK